MTGGDEEERLGAATPACLMLVEAGGGRGRRLLLFSPPIKAANKIGVGGAGGRVGVLRGIESYAPRLQAIHVH